MPADDFQKRAAWSKTAERSEDMATILAYTSPALGHLLPMSALLTELLNRGHSVNVRTLSTCVQTAGAFGFSTAAIDPQIEAIQLDDWTASNPRDALKLGVVTFGRRAALEVSDLANAIETVRPDALLIDVNCWGALSQAEATGLPWASFCPYTPALNAPGVPPFGLGLRPLPGVLGQMRDAAVRNVVIRQLEKIMLPPINSVRADVGLPAAASMDEFLRRAPLLFVTSGKPFQYPQSDWGEAVQMIGPCAVDPASEMAPDWLTAIDKPVVLVTTSSEKQGDADLVSTAIAALADEPVHVVATVPANHAQTFTPSPNATVRQFIPHGLVLDRAVCAVTHGGMGATQKALARGVPVCVVPFGRDQFEVARRVEVAHCGTRLPARKLSPPRLRTKVREAMAMTDGAKRVAAGFEATGGAARGADLFEQRVLRQS
jgi:MGT family glycosyltransferase